MELNCMARETETIVGSVRLWMEESEKLLSDLIDTKATKEEESRSEGNLDDQQYCAGMEKSNGKIVKSKDLIELTCSQVLAVPSKEHCPQSRRFIIGDTDTDIIWSNLVGTINNYGGSDESLEHYLEDEWEDALARRILRVYANKVTDEHIQAICCTDSSGSKGSHDCGPKCCSKGEGTVTKSHLPTSQNNDGSVTASNTIKAVECQRRETRFRPKYSSSSLVSRHLGGASREMNLPGMKKSMTLTPGEVRCPFVPKMIWFRGRNCTSGLWDSSYGEMPADIHDMLMNEQFRQFLAVVESTAGNWVETNSSSLMKRKNYIYFYAAFAEKAIESKQFPIAMDLLHRASCLASDDEHGTLEARPGLMALINW
eukprot:CAMPEP_0116009226 /NCGR_PEP_ID=MMETSP0321-20121206/3312_1 /TAXON_ID=163516 /ORGANISM="Leptocylindrus danicus var. danicus, Strain B650" /LENGTH=369 /DNA_ID=CAMNT_0003478159 /DNA_START=1128 /DNA_END=2234 /DNA_ORIENTATION=+